MDIQSHQFISFFEPEQAHELCQIAIIEHFKNPATIFEEGEIPDFLYLVLEGTVLFRKHTQNGHYQIVARAIPNEFFGEFGILDGQPRSAQAVIQEEAILAKIPRSILMELLNNTKSGVVLKLFRYVIHRLRVTTEEYVKHLAHKEKMVLMGEMVNTIIHDFKSPLSGIHLSSGMIREIHEDDETLEWCDLIQAQAERMTAMAEELLEFARGSAVLEKRPVNLLRMLERFEKLNRVYLTQQNIQFAIHSEAYLVIKADENKLLRVIQNLVINAVESFCHRGGQVVIKTLETSTGIQIQIQDNGPGIPESIRETFFESFVTHGKKGGTGLGTAIAKSIIEGHGGTIRFESSHETGTIFFIDLPWE
ncbi:cyclic nucleotide-binding domain-containing protein [Spirulina subsalsa FACHB-351]|uniref:histidine kinase n=1 Tax=Spirulina subsalsa FACHB-351 TaxID=234711 RepID=A0ABT3L6M4_9CYAN|nr:ATP-binding protein [Spirulina subsalsa]MCW6036729.1 cyclic nucleotide-binding domain-containing protein [Spirulina subsalsa FACHB-351]